MKINTVKIKDKGDYIVINECDFDPETHELFDAPKPITRSSIATMGKKDVVDLLEMHGADTSGKLPALRERLVETIFVEG